MKQQQEAERLAREAKKKVEEEAAKREKQEKLEAERQKREQERLRKEEEKRHREEERLRKEEEKKRRVKEEKERAAEKERKRKEKEEKERIAKEKLQKAKLEEEEKERLEREKAQKAKAEKEEKNRLEKEKAHKLKAETDEKERLKQEAAVKKAMANAIVDQKSPIAATIKPVKQAEVPVRKLAKTPSPPPGITPSIATPIDDSSDRQQVLIDALVGSGRSNFIESSATVNTTPIRPPPHLQHPSFMPSHLDILQGSPSSSSLLNASPIDHPSPSTLSDNSPSLMGMFNNRVTSPLEPSSSSRRSNTPIAPIGQPINGRRVSSVPLGNSLLHDTPSDPIIAASNAVKRPSVASPFDSAEPRSFFSSFLFGEPRNNIMPMNDYDTRFTQQPAFDRRFSSEPNSHPMQPNWTNGWTATSVLSDNVHGKLFGDALVNDSI